MSMLTPAPLESTDLLYSDEKSESQKMKEILDKYPTPPHLQTPSTEGPLGRLRYICFKILCLCAYGQPNLDPIWAAIKLEEDGDASAWREKQRRTRDQLNNLIVVAGLLLATSAVFITTTPPNPSMLDYTRRGPYICICGSFGVMTGTIIVSSICIIVTDKIPASYVGRVLYANTLHAYFTLIVVAYPSTSLSVATLLLSYGTLTAAWTSKDAGFQFGGVVLLLIPVSIGAMFAIASKTVSTKLKEPEEIPDTETQ